MIYGGATHPVEKSDFYIAKPGRSRTSAMKMRGTYPDFVIRRSIVRYSNFTSRSNIGRRLTIDQTIFVRTNLKRSTHADTFLPAVPVDGYPEPERTANGDTGKT